jgi:uncharacterized protein DUF222/HNH endonuclease
MAELVNSTPMDPEMASLAAAIDRFCDRRMTGRSPSELANELTYLRHQCDRLELEFSQTAAEFAATDEYDQQGMVSPIHWIRLNCHMGSGAAADRIAVGEQLERLSQSVETMAKGEIGFAHLALIARTAAAIAESETSKPFDETPLLNKARDLSVGRFRDFCHHARHAADPEGYAAEQAQGVEARVLSLSSGESGMVWVRGMLDAEGGAAVRTALEPLARRNGQGDYRKRERRLADALVELATHSLDAGLVPQRASQRTHMQVTTTLETLLQRAGAPAADLEFALPISAKAVERMACDCNVTRILLGSDSAVIDVGRSKRVISPAQKRALNVRDKGCRFPGCDRPATWTSGHHLVHWIRGGGTDLPNLVLLCYRHHWMVHEGRWQLVKTDEGQVLAIPPTWDLYQQLARGPGVKAA